MPSVSVPLYRGGDKVTAIEVLAAALLVVGVVHVVERFGRISKEVR